MKKRLFCLYTHTHYTGYTVHVHKIFSKYAAADFRLIHSVLVFGPISLIVYYCIYFQPTGAECCTGVANAEKKKNPREAPHSAANRINPRTLYIHTQTGCMRVPKAESRDRKEHF